MGEFVAFLDRVEYDARAKARVMKYTRDSNGRSWYMGKQRFPIGCVINRNQADTNAQDHNRQSRQQSSQNTAANISLRAASARHG